MAGPALTVKAKAKNHAILPHGPALGACLIQPKSSERQSVSGDLMAGPAVIVEAKKLAIEESMPDLELALKEAIEDLIPPFDRDLVLPSEAHHYVANMSAASLPTLKRAKFLRSLSDGDIAALPND